MRSIRTLQCGIILLSLVTSEFLWVILPIVAVPWGYAFVNYIYDPKK